MSCPKCGVEVPQNAGPGRSRTYCSTGCRRAREYELRRLQKALEDVEDRLRWCRINSRGSTDLAAGLEAERVALEGRLRALLSHSETTTEVTT